MEDKKIYRTKTQLIKLAPIKTAGLILDVGGGGEGVVGKLNGKQVIAIDINERELRETKNQALKIVMNAANLKFLSHSFSVCTAFFSLMYMPKSKHLKVFKEIYRVLRDNGKFLLWDVKIPERQGDYGEFAVFLNIQLPREKVETGYGTKWNKLHDI